MFPRRRQIALTNVVAFGAKLASAQKGMCSEHVAQSNAGVMQKSSIRKRPNIRIRALTRETGAKSNHYGMSTMYVSLQRFYGGPADYGNL